MVQVLSPRPFPQVADLRECRFLRAVFHSQAIATEASREQMECRRHRDRQKNTQPPSTTKQTTRHSRVQSGHCDPPSTTKRSFRSGTSASQESLTIRSRKLARLSTVAERPLGADPVYPSALNSHERSCFLDRPPSQLLNAARRPADSFDDARPATSVGRGSPQRTAHRRSGSNRGL